MKNNIKIIIVILVAFVAIVSFFVYYQKTKQVSLNNDTTLVSEESITGTYVANLAKDVYTLEILSQQGESFKGKLDIKNFEKDSSTGNLTGTYKNGILLANYTFNSEGTVSVNQVIFKKTTDGFVRGYGDVDKATGTRFADLNAITYDLFTVYKKALSNNEKASTNINVQGKLNINLVCENALSYMIFKDSDSANKFVAECKNGEHPEVIEDYKAQLNLGEGVEI